VGALNVYMIAGEPSGDRLGAALIRGLRDEAGKQVDFQGIGGDLMIEQGLQSLFPMQEISIMGVVEILSHYRALKARIRQTAEDIIAARPDVLITIDLPEFSLRVARLVRAASDIRIVHYVAPTVWAWRPGRAAKMAAYVDQVLALLPFEPPYMQAAGMRCDFVGHPVVTEPRATLAEAETFRADHGVGEAPLVLVLPGSRRSEVSRLTPVLGQVLGPLSTSFPDLRVVVVAASPVAEAVKEAVLGWPIKPIIVSPLDQDPVTFQAQKRAAFAAATAALAASGTVSLELAATRTPMVIAYDMNWVSRQIIGRMLRVDTVTLVNLVAESRAIPEFIGKRCRPGLIASAMKDVLSDPEAQYSAMAVCMDRLGAGGDPPGHLAARAVLSGLTKTSKRP
jgi:lipid-A-disaccharide synthase